MFQALARMMDVPTALKELAPKIRGIGRGGALLIFACSLIVAFPLAYFWWRFDLASTWHFFDWLAAGAPTDLEAARTALAGRAETTAIAPDAETAVMIALLLPWCFTLLPSAVQMGLARFVSVPGLGQIVKASILFDLITDWPTMWVLADGNPWFGATFRWAPLVWLVKVVATAIGTVLTSLVVQTALVLVVAVLFYVGAVLVFGDGPRQPGRRIVEVAD